jgi:hypothetical protein
MNQLGCKEKDKLRHLLLALGKIWWAIQRFPLSTASSSQIRWLPIFDGSGLAKATETF